MACSNSKVTHSFRMATARSLLCISEEMLNEELKEVSTSSTSGVSSVKRHTNTTVLYLQYQLVPNQEYYKLKNVINLHDFPRKIRDNSCVMVQIQKLCQGCPMKARLGRGESTLHSHTVSPHVHPTSTRMTTDQLLQISHWNPRQFSFMQSYYVQSKQCIHKFIHKKLFQSVTHDCFWNNDGFKTEGRKPTSIM